MATVMRVVATGRRMNNEDGFNDYSTRLVRYIVARSIHCPLTSAHLNIAVIKTLSTHDLLHISSTAQLIAKSGSIKLPIVNAAAFEPAADHFQPSNASHEARSEPKSPDQADAFTMSGRRRYRSVMPTSPKPTIVSAQVPGSGAADT